MYTVNCSLSASSECAGGQLRDPVGGCGSGQEGSGVETAKDPVVGVGVLVPGPAGVEDLVLGEGGEAPDQPPRYSAVQPRVVGEDPGVLEQGGQ